MNKKNFYKKRLQPNETEYIPQGEEKVLTTKVEALGLHPKTKELFGKTNIVTVYDIAKRNSKQLFKIQGFGKKDLMGVERELGKLGLTLAPDIETQEITTEDKKSEIKETEQKDYKKAVDKEVDKNQFQHGKDKKYENRANSFQKPLQKNNKPQRQEKAKAPVSEYKRITKGDKIGLAKGNQEILPAMYDEVFTPKEDMICVDVNGLFGYVNMQNELIIEPKYELAQSFSQGLANVMLNEKYGYIDKTGETVLAFEYDLATPFEEDETARIKKDGRWASITKEGKITWI